MPYSKPQILYPWPDAQSATNHGNVYPFFPRKNGGIWMGTRDLAERGEQPLNLIKPETYIPNPVPFRDLDGGT